jgi:phage baseplate assembly protein W
MDKSAIAFPFQLDDLGRVATATGDANVRAKILQVLLTSPGERVNLPEFGCGLRDLVFDPNNDILAATTEFTVTKSLQRWLPDDILVDDVNIASDDSELTLEVTYHRRDRLERGQVKIAF